MVVFRHFTLTNLLRAAKGWTEPKEIILTIPIGLWGNPGSSRYEIGAQMLSNVIDGLNSFGAAFLEEAGEDRDYAQRLITEAVNQYKDSNWRMSINMYFRC